MLRNPNDNAIKERYWTECDCKVWVKNASLGICKWQRKIPFMKDNQQSIRVRRDVIDIKHKVICKCLLNNDIE